jgi:multidrug resistance efflux pump
VYAGDKQKVHKGDLLLAFDPREYDARLSQARVGVALATEQARAQVAQAEAAVRQAEINLSYPGLILKEHVDSIQRGFGSRFSLLPPENATGNFVKVVQRVLVKSVFDRRPDPSHPLGPGMSVVPAVRTR